MAKGYVFDLKEEALHINVARYVKEKSKHYEVVIDPDLAEDFKKGKVKNVSEVLKVEDVFTDAKKALRPAESDLVETFGTKDKLKVAEIIIRKGIIQTSDKYRDELRKQKRNKLVELIRVNCIDAKTGLPFPPQRVENAFEEAKIKIDDHKTAEDQVQEVIKQLRTVLPIKTETKVYGISIPAKYASKTHNILKQFAALENEKWNSDGSFSCKIEIPAGMKEEFFDKVNALTHGDAQIEELK
ncbi:ribosome assembly factor SBDS [Candidatus Woesearchaeota archaeon]|nr:ribosome assembly factor SBDS [Candidatus Woesearchaeota archaeon]